MRNDLQDKLIKEFPLLYKTLRYIDCRDGWYDLLYALSAKLEMLILAMGVVVDDERPKAAQVKEKFGGLRFYMATSTLGMEELIAEAETKSLYTCEVCGETGSNRTNLGWHQTLCDQHYTDEINKKRMRDVLT